MPWFWANGGAPYPCVTVACMNIQGHSTGSYGTQEQVCDRTPSSISGDGVSLHLMFVIVLGILVIGTCVRSLRSTKLIEAMEEYRMYVTIADFIKEWNREAMLTQKVLDGLTDDSLNQQVYPEGRTLGRIVWHFTTNIPEYLAHFGLEMNKVLNADNVPTSAREISETFQKVSAQAVQVIEQQWTDESLSQVQNAFGREETNASILIGLIKHIVHHRGQATILIRQAGLKPFGVYGPSKEDWINLGVENPPL